MNGMSVAGILGRKVGMTQVFDEAGAAIPVTVIEAGPCPVVEVRTPEKNGYRAVSLGFETLPEKRAARLPRPRRGQFKDGLAPTRTIREFRVRGEEGESPAAGTVIAVGDVLAAGDTVDVAGVTKGKGFQGPVKRHGFGGGRETHGSNFHRRQGSIGAATDPGRVFPGRRMAGRMGGDRRTIRNLAVVEVDAKENLLLLRGAVPGRRGSLVEIRLRRRGGAKRKEKAS